MSHTKKKRKSTIKMYMILIVVVALLLKSVTIRWNNTIKGIWFATTWIGLDSAICLTHINKQTEFVVWKNIGKGDVLIGMSKDTIMCNYNIHHLND